MTLAGLGFIGQFDELDVVSAKTPVDATPEGLADRRVIVDQNRELT
jgi:hypothetical protein